MRKFVLGSILLLLLTVTLVSAQDEDDMTTMLFTPLVAGEPVTAAFEGSLTMHLYTFNALEGDFVTISMVQGEDVLIDPYLILLGPRGEVVAYNDDSEDSDDPLLASAIVDAEIPADGSYIVVAATLFDLNTIQYSQDNPLDESVYEIMMAGASEVEIPEGESPIQLAGLTLEAGQSGDLTVTFEEPVYYIFFMAEEGQTVSLETGDASVGDPLLSDTMLWVFDRTGIRFAAVDDVEDNRFAEVEFEAPYTGIYMAFATYPFFYWAADVEEAEEFFGAGSFGISLSAE